MKPYTCDLMPPEAMIPGNCNWCGTRLPRNKDLSIKANRRWCGSKCRMVWEKNHVWKIARERALYRDKRCCVKCGATDTAWDGKTKLEVNHIIPLVGRGYSSSCFHHLDNLETVCKGCHVTITKAQRAERKAQAEAEQVD